MNQYAEILEQSKIAAPSFEKLPTKQLRLRWRFDFADKPTKRGVWDAGSMRPEDAAWAVNKTGLVAAFIEAEIRHSQEELELVRCPGQDFAMFQWEAYAKMPGLLKGNFNFTPRTTISGLSILTRNEKITVYVNGKIERKPLNEDQKKFSTHEHSLV